MDSRKIVIKETLTILIGQLLCVGAMFGIYALLSRLDGKVLLGGVVGLLLATLNFFFMGIGATLAADKAESQDVTGGKKILKLSMLIRYVVLFVTLIAFGKSGLCSPLALVLPLAFVRPIMTVGEFFRKKGGTPK